MWVLRSILIPVLTILIFFITLFLYTKLAGPIPFSVDSVVTNKSDIFTVTGEGKSSQKPDLATVRAGVTVTGPTVKMVQNEMNQSIDKVTEALKLLGIKSEDIQTENYSIYPNYDYQSGSQKITGYSANTTISIKVRDIENVNSVIDTASSNGANQISGVTFEIADKANAENEARQKAVEDAKIKAEAAARIAGFNLGRIINYSESFNPPMGMPYPAMERSALSVDQKTQVEPGTQDITIQVYLSYEIR